MPLDFRDIERSRDEEKASHKRQHNSDSGDPNKVVSPQFQNGGGGQEHLEDNQYVEEEEDEVDEEEEEIEEVEDTGWPNRMQRDFPSTTNMGKSRGSSSKTRKKIKQSNKQRGNNFSNTKNYSNYSHEYQIKRRILDDYDKTTRPVRNDSTTTVLFVGMSLFHILDTVRNS